VALAAPTLPQSARCSRFFQVLEAWHLLSLDAPTVAGLWAWSFARAVHLHLPWSAPLLLALGTWLIYVADRILDGFRADAASLRPRHHFYARHWSAFVAMAVAGGTVLLWLIVERMNPRARREDTFLFLAALLYFLLIHLPLHRLPLHRMERWLPKEMAVGILFSAATAVPAWSRLSIEGSVGSRALLPSVFAFAVLCWLNCVAIEAWEDFAFFIPGHNGGSIRANLTTRYAGTHLPVFASLLVVVAVMLGLATWANTRSLAALDFAIAASSILLALLDGQRYRISPMGLRIAADAVLLTPVLVIPLLW